LASVTFSANFQEALHFSALNVSMTLLLAVKALVHRTLGPQVVGMIDYVRAPSCGKVWGGPFNGQLSRQALFQEIIAKTQPHAIVETGTYFGTTTDLLAATGIPVYTIEADPYNFGFARARFWCRRNVRLLLGDSRETLRKLFAGPFSSGVWGSVLFFYLDAHWNDDLPLAEELDIVFSRCPSAIVMIDDFQVPFDAGYGYDNYGSEKALVAGYIAPAVSAHGLQTFYPSTYSGHESGARRGCVVVAKHRALVATLSSLSLLRCDDGSSGERNRSMDHPTSVIRLKKS
jgi:hypothetical protein